MISTLYKVKENIRNIKIMSGYLCFILVFLVNVVYAYNS